MYKNEKQADFILHQNKRRFKYVFIFSFILNNGISGVLRGGSNGMHVKGAMKSFCECRRKRWRCVAAQTTLQHAVYKKNNMWIVYRYLPTYIVQANLFNR